VLRTQELASDGRPTQLLSSKVASLPENFGNGGNGGNGGSAAYPIPYSGGGGGGGSTIGGGSGTGGASGTVIIGNCSKTT